VRTVPLAVALVVVALSLSAGTALADAPDCETVSYPGSGTVDDPYEVATVDQLQCLGTAGESGLGDHYELVGDVDAAETATWNEGDGFVPIGTPSRSAGPFRGTLDGNGHAVTGLTVDRPRETVVGAFGVLGRDAVVRNLTLTGVSVTGDAAVGGLAGVSEGVVRGSSVDGQVSGTRDTGGAVGFNAGTIRNTSTSGTVAGRGAESPGDGIGGLVALNEGRVLDASSTATVEGGPDVGGLVAANDGVVNRSSASGTVTGETVVGGLVGGNAGTVDRSFATGSVGGTGAVGGLVGQNGATPGPILLEDHREGPGATVTRSYATGDVEGDRATGGLAGTNLARIVESYAAGRVVADAGPAGGLVGTDLPEVRPRPPELEPSDTRTTEPRPIGPPPTEEPPTSGEAVDAYWDRRATGRSTSAGGTGLSTTAMTGATARTAMSGFDFGDTWRTVSGDYPVLDWQNRPPTASDDAFTVVTGTTLSRSTPGLLGNDADPDGDDLSVSLVSGPSEGALDLDADGSFEYTPGAGFDGEDSFTYRVADGDGETDTATVTVSAVGPEPDPEVRVAVPDRPTTAQVGERVTVDAVVRNLADTARTTVVQFGVGGTRRDDAQLRVPAGGRETVTLSWRPDGDDTGSHRALVRTPSSASGFELTITPPDARQPSVAVTGTTSPVVEGVTLAVNVTVESESVAGNRTIALSVAGERRDTRSVALSPGENRTTTLRWATRPGDAGEYDAAVTGIGENATVELAVADRTVATYANATGVVDDRGLNAAIVDWSRGRLDDDLLNQVIGAWARGDRVAD
jgi:hypothetical protein